MAKQGGPFYITGCYGSICFYRMGGKYYARLKSSLDGKRVRRDPAFYKTMHYAKLLGRAAKIASSVYKGLPEEEKERSLYRKLTGRAMLLLKEGKREEESIIILNAVFNKKCSIGQSKETKALKNSFADEVLNNLFNTSPVYNDVERLCEYEALPP
jgi:hypothetical protein